MTDQYQWQGALAAAEHAIRDGQLEAAAGSLQTALIHIGAFEPNDPARLPILAALLRCCARAIERSDEQSLLARRRRMAEVRRLMTQAGEHSPLTFRQAAAQLPDELEDIRDRGRSIGRLHNAQTSATYMLLDSQVAQYGEESTEVVSTLLALDRLEWGYGREDKSFDILPRALFIRERMLGIEHPETLLIAGRLASRYETWGRYERAIPLWQRLLAYAERHEPLTIHNAHYGVSEILFTLGKAYTSLQRYSDALNTWKRYLDLTEHNANQATERFAVEKLRLIDAYYGIGNAYSKLEDWSQAQSLLAKAVDKHRAVPDYSVNEGSGLSTIDLAQGIAVYAEASNHSGEYDQALPLFEEAIVLYKRKNLRYAQILRNYATALQAMGKTTRAALAEREALTLIERFEATMRHRRNIVAARPDSALTE